MIILQLLLAILLAASLYSFNPADPGWTYTGLLRGADKLGRLCGCLAGRCAAGNFWYYRFLFSPTSAHSCLLSDLLTRVTSPGFRLC